MMNKSMRLFGAVAMGAALFLSQAGAEAAEKDAAAVEASFHTPTCVLMRFSDDTRFKALESNERFSDLVMEKLLESGKVRLQVQTPINKDVEDMLYNERSQEFIDAKRAIESGDLSAVFEGQAFSDETANTFSTAEQGQTITPSLTGRIGKENEAEYLIHGTIVELGKGAWEDMDFKMGMQVGATVLNNIPGLGIFGSIASIAMQNSHKNDEGFGVVADMRIIRAADGKVVWNKRASVRSKKTKNIGISIYSKDSAELNETDYVKALEKAAGTLVGDMVKDINEHRLSL